MTASVPTQDPNTYKVQKNAIYYEKKKKKKKTEREKEEKRRRQQQQQKDAHIAFCSNKWRSLEPFMCLDLILMQQTYFIILFILIQQKYNT